MSDLNFVLAEQSARLEADLADAEANCETVAAEGLYYLHADHLGRPQFATDTNGAVVWDMGEGVTPFGDSVNLAGAFAQQLMFPGQYADLETGGEGDDVTLSHNWHRTYDPTLGRYLQSDPIGLAGGLNRYAYVGGNPVGAVDPMGLKFVPSGGRGNGYVTINGGSVSAWIADKEGTNGSDSSVVCGCGEPPSNSSYDIDFILANGQWYKIKDGEAVVNANSVRAGATNRWYLKPSQRVYKPYFQAFYWDMLDNHQGNSSPTDYVNNIETHSVDAKCYNLPQTPVIIPNIIPGIPEAVGF